jgi:hypothetical protein
MVAWERLIDQTINYIIVNQGQAIRYVLTVFTNHYINTATDILQMQGHRKECKIGKH